MLQKAMNHLKITDSFIIFITSLFTNHTNWVFTHHSITDPYNMIVKIDQEEIICFLLWYIYYDLLLYYIQNQPGLGYQLSYSWSSQVTALTDRSLSASIPDIAFINDTTWIISSQSHIKSILSVIDSFFTLNDILINDDKVIFLTND